MKGNYLVYVYHILVLTSDILALKKVMLDICPNWQPLESITK